MIQIEFFYDYGSPYSYLANSVVPGLAVKHGAELVYRPMLLGGVFKTTGNSSPAFEKVENKRSYGGIVMRRTAEMYDVPISVNPHFPINTLGLMRLAIAAQKEGVFEAFHDVVYPAFWQQGLDLGDVEVQSKLLSEAGLDAAALLARAADDDVKQALKQNTGEAANRGAFGAPTLFVGDEMFFGVDHLPHLERLLSRSGGSS